LAALVLRKVWLTACLFRGLANEYKFALVHLDDDLREDVYREVREVISVYSSILQTSGRLGLTKSGRSQVFSSGRWWTWCRRSLSAWRGRWCTGIGIGSRHSEREDRELRRRDGEPCLSSDLGE